MDEALLTVDRRMAAAPQDSGRGGRPLSDQETPPAQTAAQLVPSFPAADEARKWQ
ncbi:hypothetical protein [Streptomyces sp. NPDC003273]|uniref:hypothetical protein n=1 Tax=Streptomyces sp. NPDC003273 TaxID=3364678 RepID=UPI0036A3622B